MWFLWKLGRLRRRLERDPSARRYTDVAIARIEGDESEALELYQATAAARGAVAAARARSEAIRAAQIP
jgi:hypothetical protein